MLRKIVDSKIYRIIIFVLEGIFLINIGIMFYKGKFGNNEPVNWTYFWINVLVVAILFIFDCLINASAGKMIFVKTRKEKGFQATRYCYISLITSVSLSLIMWLTRTIQYMGVNEGGTFTFLLFLVVLTTTIFCIFFFMLILFLINNKIVLGQEEFMEEQEKEKNNKNNNSNKNNLLKF